MNENESSSIGLVKVINMSKTLKLPSYESEGADGMDLRACFDCIDENGKVIPIKRYFSKTDGREDCDSVPSLGSVLILSPGSRALIQTGLKVEIPSGYRMHITPRSGLALKFGVTVLNSPGKIDSDYRGHIGIILINQGKYDFIIKHGDRIAQMSLEKSYKCKWDEVKDLSSTDRNEGGFGSSGIK